MSRLTTYINTSKTARLHLQEAELCANTRFDKNIVAAVRALQVSVNNLASIAMSKPLAKRRTLPKAVALVAILALSMAGCTHRRELAGPTMSHGMSDFQRFHYEREMELAHGFDLYAYEAATQGLTEVQP